jgi:20S proteasome alpha/beta subunit
MNSSVAIRIIWIFAAFLSIDANVDPIEGRYSFSLTTFHPSGKLPQLSHAIKASTLGPPIIAVRNQHGISLASLQSLPSPLIRDDGTSRFVSITNSIIVGHTGVNADGRVVTEAAQRLAVEHAYTFQEEIPMNILLEELALLFQEYTMKAGVRPFGCCLIVAGVNDGLFQIDPAGTVTKLDRDEKGIGFAGKGDASVILERIQEKLEELNGESKSLTDLDNLLVETLQEQVAGGERIGSSSQSIICASLSSKRKESLRGHRIRRVPVGTKKESMMDEE